MSGVPLLDVAAAAMDAQRGSLDVLARNLAASSVAGARGYERFVPVVGLDESGLPELTGTRREHGDPGDTVTEMMAVLSAQRAYEGDAGVFAAGKHLAERTIDLERG